MSGTSQFSVLRQGRLAAEVWGTGTPRRERLVVDDPADGPSRADGPPRKLMDVRRLAMLGWTAPTLLRDGVVQTCRRYTEAPASGSPRGTAGRATAGRAPAPSS